MTDILCNWLNSEVVLSQKIDKTNFSREFASGYLMGEVLAKHQLQDDFDQFSQNKTNEAKLNNFTRLEPVLHLLGIPFDTNVAKDVMSEKHEVATRVMYQVYVALNKKEKSNLTGVAMETMRPAAPAKLESVESLMYKERLKHLTPRQTDLNLEALGSRFHEKKIEMEKLAFKERFEEQERQAQMLQDHRQELLQKYRENKARQTEMLARIQAAKVEIPKTPPSKTVQAIAMRKANLKNLEAENMKRDIAAFEEKLKRTLPPSRTFSSEESFARSTEDTTRAEKAEVAALPDNLDLIKPVCNDEYIGKIRKRLNEDAAARAEREKRRRKVLVDQLKAHDAQEESRREEMLVNRLMRQSQQERRIAVQLLQARHEKEVIRKNRLLREQQYEERRLRDFQEALNQEAEMARLAKLEYIQQTKMDQELHQKLAAEQAEARYQKHYQMCWQVVDSVVDFTSKVAEYRQLTNRLLPEKLMREWKLLFTEGKPLYEPGDEEAMGTEEPTPAQILEQERQQLLDEGDFNEYQEMIGEWQPPEESEIKGPPGTNPILGHIVQRLYNMVHPPSPPPAAPEFPPFPIKACVLGKVFSGKTSCVKRLAESHRLQVLNAEQLIHEAVEAHKEGETVPEPEEEEGVATPAMEDKPSEEAVPPPSAAKSDGSPHPPGSAPPQEASQSVPDNRQADGQTDAPPASSESKATEQKDDGAEKTDPEKPYDASREGTELTDEDINKSATARAKLGSKAMKFLRKGKPVDDALIVEILVEAIRRIPEGTGWVMDGFPATYSQAKLLEKALSGIDTASRESSKLSLNQQSKAKMKSSKLAPDPRPSVPPPEPASGVNVVILFELDDALCLKRSAGRTYASQSEQEYQQEFNPPPEGSATGLGKVEKVAPVVDTAHDMEQIQHRITNFQDSWPKMEKWFVKFGSLKKVDASQSQDTVYYEVENILEETVNKLLGKDQEESLPVEVELEEKPPEPEPKPATPPPEPPKEEERPSRPSSKKGSRAGSAKRSGSRGSKDSKKGKEKSPSPKRGSKGSPEKSPKGSRGSSPKSGKRGKSGKRSKTPPPEPEPAPEPQEPPGPAPGSDEWEFVDQPIDEELANILAPHWEVVEATYVDASKAVFHKLRDERENIYRYLYQIRQDYLAYLRRPDHKQEFITQWQKEYNQVSDDMRDDEEVRCELHQRVDDVRERLWNICDERKEAAEKEREGVISDGWLDDHLGLLSNHYITLMQVEVDRYQDTIRMLKDYYRGMDGKIPDELQAEYIRIPLVELPTQTEEDGKPGTAESGRATSTEGDEVKSSTSKAGTPSGKRRSKPDITEDSQANAEEERKPRIPLVPRRPVSPEAGGSGGKGGKQDKTKAKKDAAPDLPDGVQPPTDPDMKLIFDAHLNGLQAIDRMMAAEKAAKEAEEEMEKEKEREKEREKEKQATASKGKKGDKKKGGKSRSPSPKKGKGSKEPEPIPTPVPSEEISEEEKEKKKIKERMKMEYFAAMEQEAVSSKTRLDLIKMVSQAMLQDLKDKAESGYKDMEDWLGARFLKEMESIDHVSQVMRHAIEEGQRIREQLVLEQQDFLLDENIKVVKSPSPEPLPPPIEEPQADSCTVDQLMAMYKQFKLTAPGGVMSLKSFQDTFLDLSQLTHGSEQLPDAWVNCSQQNVEATSLAFSADGEYVDWRAFLLAAAMPWPAPSQSELLETLARFQEMDQKHTGYVFREQFDRVDLWFTAPSERSSPDNSQEPVAYNRIARLKAGLFDIFCDDTVSPPQLDYVKMLMYFAVDPDPYEGLLRALSVAAGTHMPRLPKPGPRPASRASLMGSEDLDKDKSVESRVVPSDIPESAIQAKVPLEALHRVLRHGQCVQGDSHRFSVITDPEEAFQMEKLQGVYQELGSEALEPVALTVLLEHPVIQDMVAMVNTFRALDLRNLARTQAPDNTDAHSTKTTE